MLSLTMVYWHTLNFMQEPGPVPLLSVTPPSPSLPSSKPEALTSVQFTEPSSLSWLDWTVELDTVTLINLDDSDTASSYY